MFDLGISLGFEGSTDQQIVQGLKLVQDAVGRVVEADDKLIATQARLEAQVDRNILGYMSTKSAMFEARASELNLVSALGIKISMLQKLEQQAAQNAKAVKDARAADAATVAAIKEEIKAKDELSQLNFRVGKALAKAAEERSQAEARAAKEIEQANAGLAAFVKKNADDQIAQAQRVAMEQIAWNRKSVAERIAILEQLRTAMNTPGLSPKFVASQFGAGATGDRNLSVYKAQEAAKEASKIAERQAIEEIEWTAKSVKERIRLLEMLRQYQANAAIPPATVAAKFGAGALGAVDTLPALKAQQAELDKKAAADKAAERAAIDHGRATDLLGRSLSRTTTVIAGAIGAAFGLQRIFQASEEWILLNNRIRVVSETTSDFTKAQNNIIRIALETRQPLAAVAELYQRIALNQKQLGITGNELAGVVKTISQTMVISGASTASAQGALMQLGQGFSAGALRGQELNSVMEQAPALALAIATGMGKTIGQLRALGDAGKLTADAIIVALQKQEDAVNKTYQGMQKTVGQAMNVVGTQFLVFIGRINDALGVTDKLANGIIWLSNNLGAVLTGVGALVAFGLYAWATAATVAVGGLAGAAVAAGVAVKGMLLGIGPWGWVILGLGAVATAWQLMGDKAETASKQSDTAADRAKAAAEKMASGVGAALSKLSAKYDELILKREQALGFAVSEGDQLASQKKDLDAKIVNLEIKRNDAAKGQGRYDGFERDDRVAAVFALEKELLGLREQSAQVSAQQESSDKRGVAQYLNDATRKTEAGKKELEIQKAALAYTEALRRANGDAADIRRIELAYAAELANINKKADKPGEKAVTDAKKDYFDSQIQQYRNADKEILSGRKAFNDDMKFLVDMGLQSQEEAIQKGMDREYEIWKQRVVVLNQERDLQRTKKNSLQEQEVIEGRIAEAGRNWLEAEEDGKRKLSVLRRNEVRDFESATIAAQRYIDTVNKQSARALAGVGQGTDVREKNAGIAQIEDKYRGDRDKLYDERRQNKITEDRYQSELQVINRFQAVALANYDEFYAAMKEKQTNSLLGATEALANYASSSSNAFAQTEKLVTNSFKSMEDAIVTFATTGKISFASLANSIIADMIRIMVQQTITGPLARMALGFFTGGASLGADVGGSVAASWAAGAAGVKLGPPRATGGTVANNTMFRVNENGPELLEVDGKSYLMMGSQSGNVVPNNKINNGQPSQTISVTVHQTVGDVATVSMLQQSNAQLVRQIQSGLARTKKYSGS